MKRFETFGEYMFDLLFAPLKKGQREINQFFIFFKVVGREFDRVKQAFFRVREESNVMTASEVMLPVHGQDRDMPRLPGETAEAYRTRLAMKGIISEWGGTKRGILYALTALGYEKSSIERVSLQDPERWAEFIVWLDGSGQSGVCNLGVIDAEVCKIKEGSSRPAYGMQHENNLVFRSQLEHGWSDYPRCNEIVCGVWPHLVSHGYLVESGFAVYDCAESGDVQLPRVAEIGTSEELHHYDTYALYLGFDSSLAAEAYPQDGEKRYLRCAETSRCSSDTLL
ncbi:serine/arginine repetitive matrix protein 2 [Clostridiaceae bacterium]|nr:serine/arginine repetitive matrix protein 2 [Clostridiaceae bacterium]